MSVPEVAQALSMSRSRLYELIMDGTITSVMIGRRRYVRSADLTAYVAGLTDEAAP